MIINRQEVQHMAKLARIGLSDQEITSLQGELSNILENFEALQRVNTDGIPPADHLVALASVTREDDPSPSTPKEDVLSNAPLREGDLFRVRAVLE